MDRDERLIRSILRQRESRGRPFWARQETAAIAVGAVLLIVALALVRASFEHGAEEPAATEREAAALPTPITAAPTAASARVDEARQDRVATTPTVDVAARPARYVVQVGDTVQSIAERHGIHADTLIAVNDIEDADLLQPGVELEVPPTDGRIYVVAAGESLREIAARYDLDLAVLIRTNDVRDPDHIAVGLRLFIPAVPSATR